MILTASQAAAINHGDSNLQLIACAGSGKTEVIARRVAHLLKSGYKPANIIAFTFTEKAAAELKERIVSRVGEELGEVHGMAAGAAPHPVRNTGMDQPRLRELLWQPAMLDP